MSRHRDRATNLGEEYVQGYPEFEKWIVQCGCCQARGHKPDMPAIIGGRWEHAADYIKKHFEPLALNELGLCERCVNARSEGVLRN